jgi:hypothetical protein
MKIQIMAVLISVILVFFTKPLHHVFSQRKLPAKQSDTIISIQQLVDTGVFKARNGEIFRVHFEEDIEIQEVGYRYRVIRNTRGVAQKVKEPNKACDNGNFFDGTYRKSAKESYVNGSGNIINPPNLAALIARLKTIDISQFQINSNTPRVAPENKSITLSSVYLYALKRESDEDYHIIIGTTQDPSTAEWFNIECAGLPPRSSPYFSTLNAARNKVVSFLNGELCKNGYTFFDDHPIIQVTGSLFYDKEHATSIVGPTQFKPLTAWELHPLVDFKVR